MARAYRSIPPLTSQDLTRFQKKVQKGKPDDCWEWKAARRSDGYGKFFLSGHELRAHRVAWRIAFGPIPAGLLVCHHCDQHSCQNPRHFFLGTQADNMRDMDRKGRRSPPPHFFGDDHPSRRHPENVARGERSGSAKLTEKQVRTIRHRAAEGESKHALAREYNVTRPSIQAIARRESWKHIA